MRPNDRFGFNPNQSIAEGKHLFFENKNALRSIDLFWFKEDRFRAWVWLIKHTGQMFSPLILKRSLCVILICVEAML